MIEIPVWLLVVLIVLAFPVGLFALTMLIVFIANAVATLVEAAKKGKNNVEEE